jgi:hypothetical protein
MAYALDITERAAAVVAAMDSETHDRFVMAMLNLATDPHSQGDALGTEGPTVTERAMALGSAGLIVYTVDDSAVRVRIVNIIWLA